MKRNGKRSALFAVFLAAVCLAGCGGRQEKFTSQDGTAGITLSSEWEGQETRTGGWIGAVKGGKASAVVMQTVKDGGGRMDTEAVQEMLKTDYQVENLEKVENPVVPEGMTRVKAFTFHGTAGDTEVEGYWSYGQTVYAFYSFLYVTEKLDKNALEEIQTAWGSFEEHAPETANRSTVEVTDTILWLNGTHAVRSALQGWDYNLFGGMPANEDTGQTRREILKEEWDVTDKASAEETLRWLAEEGHHGAFEQEMETLKNGGLSDIAETERASYLYGKYDLTESGAQVYAELYTGYVQNGADAVRAWDDSRAMALVEDCYMAGYYTETEALDKSMEIAGRIRSAYGSWDAFIDSYLLGYAYHTGEEGIQEREAYGEVKEEVGNPYLLDWNLTLEKSW